MTPDRIACQINLHMNSEAHFTCVWQRDPSHTSALFRAEGRVWQDGKSLERTWKATINFTLPTLHVVMIVEEVNGGAWRMFSEMPPVMDVSTFWWATALMLESIKQHPHWVRP